MAVLLSPGVKTRELDFSVYAAELSSTIVGMVGAARKGPAMEPTLVTSPRQFLEIFGEPISTDYGAYAALQFLSHGNQLWYVRLTDGSEKSASVSLEMTLSEFSLGTGDNSNSFEFDLSVFPVDAAQTITVTDGVLTLSNSGAGLFFI